MVIKSIQESAPSDTALLALKIAVDRLTRSDCIRILCFKRRAA